MPQPIFVNGMNFYQARSNAPKYIKGSISVHPKKFAEWAAQHENALDRGWLQIDLKESGTTGTWYLALNDYKSKKAEEKAPDEAEPTPSEAARWANNSDPVDEGSSEIPF